MAFARVEHQTGGSKWIWAQKDFHNELVGGMAAYLPYP